MHSCTPSVRGTAATLVTAFSPSHAHQSARVDKEMANIRERFTSGKPLDSYNKKKYAWKMIYMFMLGYEIDFG